MLVQPGQGVISFSPQPTQGPVMPEEEQESSIEYDDEEASEEHYDQEDQAEEEESYGEENAMMMESQDVDAEDDEAEDYEAEEEIGEEETEGTPVVVRSIVPSTRSGADSQQRSLDRFYTPQPQRGLVTNAPRTLSSIGGPAVRFQRMPETPSAGIRRVPPTPGSLGAPSRRITQQVSQDTEEDEASVGPSTPVKREVDPAILEEVSRILIYDGA